MTSAYLSIGSNLDPRSEYLSLAIEDLKAAGFVIMRMSGVYETQAWGKEDEPDYLNCCVYGETLLGPFDLLKLVKDIEVQVGRRSREHWGTREVDIDILLYGDEKILSPKLTIPHRDLKKRRFVLVPLLDVTQGNSVFIDGEDPKDILENLNDLSKVKIYDHSRDSKQEKT
ncbi:2-amino-4-hydroxy-6-hydroxymethyldihydropteridine diphosphokinase [PVC group bacterium]|nr:2-amino-4-hydroxy-6-hydroxymethyldihydropteridine diphosphokinase [PVC group bacterium]